MGPRHKAKQHSERWSEGHIVIFEPRIQPYLKSVITLNISLLA